MGEMKTTYFEKLKDPRWQRARLTVMERAGWQCQCCQSKEKTLHVHHLQYRENPWDTPPEFLECLCDDCHAWREQFNKTLVNSIRFIPTKYALEFADAWNNFPPDKSWLSALINGLKRPEEAEPKRFHDEVEL